MRITSSALVILEPFVKRAYPGGVRGFWRDELKAQGKAHTLRAEAGLVVVADTDDYRLIETVARISKLTGQPINDDAPFVLVDPDDGLIAPRDWVSFASSAEGGATIEYTGSNDSAPIGDAGAAAPAPRVPTLLKLADEDGFTTWLDTETGRQLTSGSLPASSTEDATDAPIGMLGAVKSVIDGRAWSCESDADEGTVTLNINAGPLLFLSLGFLTSSSGDVLSLVIRLPGFALEHRIAEVTRYLAGASWGLEVGSFGIDVAHGDIVYRAAIIAPYGTVRPSAVEIALDRSMATVEKYAPGLIEVAGGADPLVVLARIEAE